MSDDKLPETLKQLIMDVVGAAMDWRFAQLDGQKMTEYKALAKLAKCVDLFSQEAGK